MVTGSYTYHGSFLFLYFGRSWAETSHNQIETCNWDRRRKYLTLSINKASSPKISSHLSAHTPATLQDKQAHIERYLTTVKKIKTEQKSTIKNKKTPVFLEELNKVCLVTIHSSKNTYDDTNITRLVIYLAQIVLKHQMTFVIMS